MKTPAITPIGIKFIIHKQDDPTLINLETALFQQSYPSIDKPKIVETGTVMLLEDSSRIATYSKIFILPEDFQLYSLGAVRISDFKYI